MKTDHLDKWMRFNKKPLVRIGSGIILGGLAGVGLSYVYGLVGAT